MLATGLRRITPYTIVQPHRLASQLSRVRQDGYATTAEEMTLGACSIAVPISVAGRTIASLGVVVPDMRARARLLPAMRVTAQGIERRLSLGLETPADRDCHARSATAHAASYFRSAEAADGLPVPATL